MAVGGRKEERKWWRGRARRCNSRVRQKGRGSTCPSQKGSGIAGNIQPNRAVGPHQSKRPTGEACQIGRTFPMQAQPRNSEKGSATPKKFLYTSMSPLEFLNVS